MVTGSQIYSCYDRPIDFRPTSKAYSPRSNVIRSNVSRRVQIGIQPKSARFALKTTLTSSICFRNIPTFRTLLRSVSRIDIGYKNTGKKGFVSEKCLKTGKAPRVKSSLNSSASLHPGSNVGQIFQHDCGTLLNRLDQPLRNDMIAIAAETFLSARDLFQVSLSRLCAFRLKGSSKSKGPIFNLSPSTRSEKLSFTCYSGVTDPKVYSNDPFCGLDFFRFSFNNNMEPKTTFSVATKVGRAYFPIDPGLVMFRNLKSQMLTSRDRSNRGFSGKTYGCGMRIVPDTLPLRLRTRDLLALLLKSFSRSQGFCSLGSGRAYELGRKPGQRSLVEVGIVMEFDSIDTFLFPTNGTNSVERFGVLLDGFVEDLSLFVIGTNTNLESQRYHDSYSDIGVSVVKQERTRSSASTRLTVSALQT